MPEFTITVYRPRLERTTVTITARTQYDADEKAFKASDKIKDWKLLDKRAAFYCGDASYDNELFIPERAPRIFYESGNSKEV